MAIDRFDEDKVKLEAIAKDIIKRNGLLSLAFPEHAGRWSDIPNDTKLNLEHVDYVGPDQFYVDLKGISDDDKLSISVYRRYENGSTKQVLQTLAHAYIILNMKSLVTNVYTINEEQIKNILHDYPLKDCRRIKQKTKKGTRYQYVADLAFPTELTQLFVKNADRYMTYVTSIKHTRRVKDV